MKRCFEGASPSGCGGCRPRGGTGGTPWRARGPPRGWPTGRGWQGCLVAWPDGIRGLILLSEAWWAAPCGGGEPPTKVGGLREDILFKSKEYPLALPKKDCQGGFDFPPDNPLETTKGEACGPLLWKPLGGWTGERGLRGTVGRGFGAGCVGSFRGFRLGGDEGIGGLVVLAPGLGGWGPCGGRGTGDGGRSTPGSSCPTGGCGKPHQPPRPAGA